MTTSVLKENFESKVSSVLNRDVKQFAKKHLFDGNDETCWNSDQGSPQFISIILPKEESICSLVIQFQGGFVGQNCVFQYTTENGILCEEPFYPEDKNGVQIFQLSMPVVTKQFSVVFKRSTDFFGRIVIYKFDALSSR